MMKSKMPLYNIGYEVYEENEFTQLHFDRKLKKKELADYVHKATINALRYAIKHRNEFLFGAQGEGRDFQSLYPRVVEELKLLGFKPVKYEAEWSCFGGGDVCTNNLDTFTNTLENNLLRESIPKDLKRQALEISEKKLKDLKRQLHHGL